jgi:hypothetical protein
MNLFHIWGAIVIWGNELHHIFVLVYKITQGTVGNTIEYFHSNLDKQIGVMNGDL